MANEKIVRSIYAPVSVPDDISLPQFMTRYNPDNVRKDKVVHVDLIEGKELTYGGLREAAGRCAWGLKSRLGLKPGSIVSVLAQNSVSYTLLRKGKATDSEIQSDFVILAHSIWWSGAVVAYVNEQLLRSKEWFLTNH